jgi:hypothetical protein
MVGIMDYAVTDTPRFGRAMGVHPAGQIAPNKEENKTIVVRSQAVMATRERTRMDRFMSGP